MTTTSSKLQEFRLTILGKPFPPIRQKVFDSTDYILPSTWIGDENGRRQPKSRKERMDAWSSTPLSEWHIDILERMGQPNPYHHLSNAIDTSQLTLSIPEKNIEIKVSDFRKLAKDAAPEGSKISVAFDTYAKEKYDQSYSDLISNAREKVITRFKAAFEENMGRSQMDDEYHLDQEIFLHFPVYAPESAINEYKSLARQGHVYSQYLAGVLLASSSGGYSTECVKYLLMAYENKHPEAMRVLAEFLKFKKDYYGAVQCALLSVDGGDEYSKKIIRDSLGIGSTLLINTNNGMSPLSPVIIRVLRENGFDSILNEHFSEFNHVDEAQQIFPGFHRKRE